MILKVKKYIYFLFIVNTSDIFSSDCILSNIPISHATKFPVHFLNIIFTLKQETVEYKTILMDTINLILYKTLLIVSIHLFFYSPGNKLQYSKFPYNSNCSQCIHFNTIGDDNSQSVAIVLPVSSEDKERLTGVSALTLRYEGRPVAILRQPQFYNHRKEERVARQFGTVHRSHPTIKVIIHGVSKRINRF